MKKRRIIIAVLCVFVLVIGIGTTPVFPMGTDRINLFRWILVQTSDSSPAGFHKDDAAPLYFGNEVINRGNYEVSVDAEGAVRRICVNPSMDLDQFIASKGENSISEEQAKELGTSLFCSVFENRLYENSAITAEVSKYQYYYVDVKEYKDNVPTGNNGMIVIAENGCLISGTFLKSDGTAIVSEDYLIPCETAVEIAMKELSAGETALNLNVQDAVIDTQKTCMNRLNNQYLWEVFLSCTDTRLNQKAGLMVRINAENGEIVQIYQNT